MPGSTAGGTPAATLNRYSAPRRPGRVFGEGAEHFTQAARSPRELRKIRATMTDFRIYVFPAPRRVVAAARLKYELERTLNHEHTHSLPAHVGGATEISPVAAARYSRRRPARVQSAECSVAIATGRADRRRGRQPRHQQHQEHRRGGARSVEGRRRKTVHHSRDGQPRWRDARRPDWCARELRHYRAKHGGA